MTANPLDVAIDIGPLYGHRTGVGQAVGGMAEALERRDDVRLDRYLMSFRSTPRSGDRKLPVPGVVASQIWSRSDRPHADRWLGDADVVHGTNYVAPPSRRPTVVSVYDCWFLANPKLASPVVRRAGALLRRRVRAGAWVHATSEATAIQVRDLLGTDRVRTILLGGPAADVADHTAESAPAGLTAELGGRPFVVSVATEERRKGIPLLVHAFAQLHADRPEIALVIAGAPGDDSEAIEQAIAANAAHRAIHRLGAVEESAKQWLVRHAALLAYPSLDEGFGFPVLEAQAVGTPVVATAVGSLPEVAGDAALLVSTRQATDFAAGMDRVLSEEATRVGMIEAGFRNVKRFDWDRTASELVGLYRTAMESA